MDINKLKQQLTTFAEDRDWDQFHSPKNLVMAIGGEVGELQEIFQWLTEEQSNRLKEKDIKAASEELADILLYSIRLSDKLGIDLEVAIQEKLEINAKKYPIHLARGNATKYNKR